MLARHHAGLVKFLHELQRTVCVVDIVIGKLLSPQLFGLGKRTRADKLLRVIGRALMRIFAVTHILRFFISKGNAVGETDIQLFREVIGDHAVIRGGMRKHFILKIFLRFERDAA